MKNIIGMTAVALFATVGTVNAEPLTYLTNDQGVLANNTLSLRTSVASQQLRDEQEGIITKIIADEAIVREKPSPNADITNFARKDLPVYVSARIDNFYEVEINGRTGYIYKSQLDETGLEDIPHTISEENRLANTVVEEVYLGEEIVEYAKQFLGNPYVFGGTSLTNGIDCSSFTQQIMRAFGIHIERVSRSQYAVNGYRVSEKDLLPGDLVFYGYNGYIDHVAIYAGDGKIIHASSPKTGIIITNLRYGSKPIVGIKRVIE